MIKPILYLLTPLLMVQLFGQEPPVPSATDTGQPPAIVVGPVVSGQDSNGESFAHDASIGQAIALIEQPSPSAALPSPVAAKLSNLLPWGLTILMALVAGGLGAYLVILRKQRRQILAAQKRILSGVEPVYLLSAEALELIRSLGNEGRSLLKGVRDEAEKNRKEVAASIENAKTFSVESRNESRQLVEDFKSSVKVTLGEVSKFMKRVLEDTQLAGSQAVETKEIAKQIGELLDAKEAEINQLRTGYHLHLIAPLVQAFLKIRDEMHAIMQQSKDPQTASDLAILDRSIEAALRVLAVEEIEVGLGRSSSELPARLWESLGASEETHDIAKHGAFARVHERGYQLRTPSGEAHVIKKAAVITYTASTPAAES